MKKLFVCLLSAIMLLTCISLPVSASYVTDAETFNPVGRVEMVWDANASEHLDVTDGDMSDWADAGYSFVTIMPENMVSWVGNSDTELDPGMPENWSISTYFVADADYLYVGFYTVDDKFIYADNGAIYNGDAFQVSVDFGGLLGQIIEEDPESFTNQSNVFYSFSCVEDGAPLVFVRQCSDNDGVMSEEEVAGAARKTNDGWSAEFRMSWQQLYDDFAWKAYADGVTFEYGPDHDFYINCALYYISRDDESRAPIWAACTGTGETVTSTPADSGIKLVLPYAEDRHLNCTGITNISDSENEESTAAPETEAATVAPETKDPETTAEPETEAPDTDATDTDAAIDTNGGEGTAANTDTEKTDGGCSSVVGFGAVAVLAAAAAFVALKKKD